MEVKCVKVCVCVHANWIERGRGHKRVLSHKGFKEMHKIFAERLIPSQQTADKLTAKRGCDSGSGLRQKGV